MMKYPISDLVDKLLMGFGTNFFHYFDIKFFISCIDYY